MQTLEKFSKDTAKAFSIDDWIGIAETIFVIIKQCRDNHQSPEQITDTIRQGDGLFARLRARRAIKKNLDRGNMTMRQLNHVADHIVNAALHDAEELNAVLTEIDSAERFSAPEDEV